MFERKLRHNFYEPLLQELGLLRKTLTPHPRGAQRCRAGAHTNSLKWNTKEFLYIQVHKASTLHGIMGWGQKGGSQSLRLSGLCHPLAGSPGRILMG